MHRAKLLFDLQSLDLKIDAANEALAQIGSQLGESVAILEAQQALAERRRHQAELEGQLRSLEWQSNDLSSKIAIEESKLYGGAVRNPKELGSLQDEVNSLKGRRQEVDDQALELMDQLETLEKAIDGEAAALAAEQAAWEADQTQLKQEQEQLVVLLKGLDTERQAQAVKVDPSDLEAYEMIRTARGGRGVSRIEQGRCSGCRIGLSMTDLQRARGHDLVRCSNCGRIFYAG